MNFKEREELSLRLDEVDPEHWRARTACGILYVNHRAISHWRYCENPFDPEHTIWMLEQMPGVMLDGVGGWFCSCRDTGRRQGDSLEHAVALTYIAWCEAGRPGQKVAVEGEKELGV